MTKSQEKTIERIRRRIPNDLFFGDDYEVKQFRIEDCEYFINLVIETGMIGDEGTLAVLTRDNVQMFIGKHGGVTYPVNKKDGTMITRQFGKHDSLLTISCAQDYFH